MKANLPINEGWGYLKENACILDKNEATLDLTEAFDGVELEYIFVQYRTYKQMIVNLNYDERFSGVGLKLIE